MPVGTRIGTRIGTKLGTALGIGGDPLGGGLIGVSQDSTSGKYFPASAAEWTIVMAAAGITSGNPANLWLCQEATGNLADSIGALALTVAGTPNYQQAVTGYTRKKVSNPTDGGTVRFTATSPDDISTTSQLLLAVFDMPTANPAAVRSCLEMGAVGTRAAIEIQATGVMRTASVANTAAGSDGKNAVRPLTISENHSTLVTRGTTDADKMIPTHGAVAGTLLDVWSVATGNSSPIAGMLYCCRFSGAAAELTDAQLKSLLQTLGWSIAWS